MNRGSKLLRSHRTSSSLHRLKLVLGSNHRFYKGCTFIILTLLILRGLLARWLNQNGDAAGFVDVIADPMHTGKLDFSYGLSTKALNSLIASGPTSSFKTGLANPWKDTSFIEWHPYLLGYLTNHFNFFLSPQLYSLIFQAASIAFGILAMGMHFYSSRQLLTVRSLAFFAVVFTSPIFFESLQGQPYFDKLFFGPCIVLILILTKNKSFNNRITFYVCSLILFCILLSERSALMVSFIVYLILLSRYKEKLYCLRNIKIILIVSSSGLLWFISWRYLIQSNPYYGNISLQVVEGNIKALFFGSRGGNFYIFLVTIMPFVIVQLRKFGYLAISLCIILPNLLISIGGAELSGYVTHYQAILFPTLIAFSALSLTSISAYPDKMKKTEGTLIFLMCIGGILSIFNYNQYTTGGHYSNAQSKVIAGKILDDFGLTPSSITEGRKASVKPYIDLFKKVPLSKSTTRISTPENFMPALVSLGQSKFDYFPVGLGFDEFVVVPYTDSSLKQVAFSIYGLVPLSDQKEWSQGFIEILKLRYHALGKAQGPQGNIVIYKIIKDYTS